MGGPLKSGGDFPLLFPTIFVFSCIVKNFEYLNILFRVNRTVQDSDFERLGKKLGIQVKAYIPDHLYTGLSLLFSYVRFKVVEIKIKNNFKRAILEFHRRFSIRSCVNLRLVIPNK